MDECTREGEGEGDGMRSVAKLSLEWHVLCVAYTHTRMHAHVCVRTHTDWLG